MVKFKNFFVPLSVVSAAVAALVTGEPDLIRLWFAVWSVEHV